MFPPASWPAMSLPVSKVGNLVKIATASSDRPEVDHSPAWCLSTWVCERER